MDPVCGDGGSSYKNGCVEVHHVPTLTNHPRGRSMLRPYSHNPTVYRAFLCFVVPFLGMAVPIEVLLVREGAGPRRGRRSLPVRIPRQSLGTRGRFRHSHVS